MIASIYYLLKMTFWFFAGLCFIVVGIGWLIWLVVRGSYRFTFWMFKAIYLATERLHKAAYDRGETRTS